MAQVHPEWWTRLPETYEPDSVLVSAALSRRLHLAAIPVPDRIYLVGALSEDPHRMSAGAVADTLHCHLRTVRKYRSLWVLTGMAEACRSTAHTDSVLISLHPPTVRPRIGIPGRGRR